MNLRDEKRPNTRPGVDGTPNVIKSRHRLSRSHIEIIFGSGRLLRCTQASLYRRQAQKNISVL